MREHIFLPKPVFPRHVFFPDFIGGYENFPEHAVDREYRSTENNLDRCYNLHIVLEGKGYVQAGGQRYELTRGHGFLYGPGLRQAYRSDARQPWSIRWAHFYGERAEELLGGKGLDEPWLFALPDPSPFEELLERLLRLGRTYEVDDEFAVAATLYELLTRLVSTASRLNASADPTADRMRTAANYVRAHSAEPFTLDQAAELAGFSSYYFSRKFSRMFGMSFTDFLLESRLLHAKRLLTATSLSVKQIALETGFSQTSYFSTCFRRREGTTPQQFRAIHRIRE